MALTTGSATRTPDPSIQFYAIELCPTADGMMFVGIGATVCELEGELSHMEMGNHRVSSLEDALAVIRKTLSAH